jgi:hypothetical protein
MKRKLFLLGLILLSAALVAVPVAAFAETDGSTVISGEVTAATITVVAPEAIDLSNFVIGEISGNSSTPGTVTVTAGTAGYPVAYSVLASDANTGDGRGFMMSGANQLSPSNKFHISPDGDSYYPADIGFSYSGIATEELEAPLPLYVKQAISGNETPGVYTITIAFTASLP